MNGKIVQFPGIRLAPVGPRDDGPIWPAEAATIEEARAIWERDGVTEALKLSIEEIERLSPGYAARRSALKAKRMDIE